MLQVFVQILPYLFILLKIALSLQGLNFLVTIIDRTYHQTYACVNTIIAWLNLLELRLAAS